MRMTLGAAHFVKHKIARNFQQPGGEFCTRYVSPSASPNPDENLLRDVFHVRIAAKHSRDCAGYERLMALDQLLKGGRVADGDQSHQTDVFGVIPGSSRCFWIGH